MTLNIAMLIKANAAQAKAELASVADRTKAFGTQTRNAGNDARQAAAAMAAYETRIKAMEAELRQLIAAQGAANEKARQTKPAFDGGAQSVGYMAAQMNDLFVMTAAGQSPLQMAIQQGTQISQVYGNRGAAGAVQLFKSGFASMLSPLNLGTIAILAGSAALVQWGMSALGAAEDTVTFDDAVGNLESSVSDLTAQAQIYSATGLQGIIDKYGELNAATFQFIELQTQAMSREAIEGVRSTLSALTDEQKGFFNDSDWSVFADVFDVNAIAANNMALALRDAKSAADFDGQLASIESLKAQMLAATGGIENMTSAQFEMFLKVQQTEDAVRQLANSAPQANWMNAAITGVNGLIGRLTAAIGVNRQLAGERRAAQGTTSALSQQYAQYGAGRASAEGMIGAGAGGATDSRNAWMQENGYGGTAGEGTGGGTGGGGGGRAARAERDAVAELIAKLREEQAVLAELDPVKAQMLRYREQLSTATAAERAEVEALIMVREREKAMDQLGEFGGNSVVDLLKSIRGGADAVSASLKKVLNNLIDMGIQALILGKGPLAQLFGINGNIFQGGGGGGGNIFGQLIGGLFGGGGGTGTLGLPAFADGVIFGAGGGRDDKILARVSAGESIINARATARHRPLLERINAGLPRFADGMIGGSAGIAGGAGGAPVLNQTININGATGNSEIATFVQRGVEAGIEEFSRAYLPQRVLQINAAPRRRND